MRKTIKMAAATFICVAALLVGTNVGLTGAYQAGGSAPSSNYHDI